MRTKITIKIGGTNHRLTLEEARQLREQLNDLLGQTIIPNTPPYIPPVENPWQPERPSIPWSQPPFNHPWEIICKNANQVGSTLNFGIE